MPGLSGLIASTLGRNYGVNPGSAGYGFMTRRQPPGYYDLGGQMLPGGSLQVSPSMGGEPRSMPGIDIPVPGQRVPNATGLDYSNTLGLPRPALVQVRPDTGGPGAPPMDTTGMNIPLNDLDVPPNNNDFYYSGERPSGAEMVNAAPYAMPVIDWISTATNTGPRQKLDANGYPIPGGGQGGSTAGNWAINASRPSAPWGFGPNYVDPRSANAFFGGLQNWNGPGATNPSAGEGGPAWSTRHNIGALAARFGLSGRASGGQGAVPGMSARIS